VDCIDNAIYFTLLSLCTVLTYNIWKDNVNKFDYDDTNKRFQAPAGEIISKTYFTGNSCHNGCDVLHFIDNTGLVMQCQNCKIFHPMNDPIQISKRYPTLNVIFNQTIINNINNTTVNNYNGGEDLTDCSVDIDETIFNDPETTDLVNQILDGHRSSSIAALMKKLYNVFFYDKKNNEWYYFDGSIWSKDGDSDFKKKLLELRHMIFDKIIKFYKNKPSSDNIQAIKRTVKNLIIK
jgi:hypothetical protein